MTATLLLKNSPLPDFGFQKFISRTRSPSTPRTPKPSKPSASSTSQLTSTRSSSKATHSPASKIYPSSSRLFKLKTSNLKLRAKHGATSTSPFTRSRLLPSDQRSITRNPHFFTCESIPRPALTWKSRPILGAFSLSTFRNLSLTKLARNMSGS